MFYFLTLWPCLDGALIQGHSRISNYYVVHAASQMVLCPIGPQGAGFLRSGVNEASVGGSHRTLSWMEGSSSPLKLAHLHEYEHP